MFKKILLIGFSSLFIVSCSDKNYNQVNNAVDSFIKSLSEINIQDVKYEKIEGKNLSDFSIIGLTGKVNDKNNNNNNISIDINKINFHDVVLKDKIINKVDILSFNDMKFKTNEANITVDNSIIKNIENIGGKYKYSNMLYENIYAKNNNIEEPIKYIDSVKVDANNWYENSGRIIPLENNILISSTLKRKFFEDLKLPLVINNNGKDTLETIVLVKNNLSVSDKKEDISIVLKTDYIGSYSFDLKFSEIEEKVFNYLFSNGEKDPSALFSSIKLDSFIIKATEQEWIKQTINNEIQKNGSKDGIISYDNFVDLVLENLKGYLNQSNVDKDKINNITKEFGDFLRDPKSILISYIPNNSVKLVDFIFNQRSIIKDIVVKNN